ncbi:MULTISPECIES: 3-isopropylmalate dehydratase [unclassified Flavobacterium]|uniref:3-isopropylmalate dehydratase n=1 Tax=unclassified Flavobacterium TaxID=196869 RepID=UPI0008683D6B|nr:MULTISPECIES: 3-isopropylmalate dehydratase [unclassified Flavobacterium]MBN9285545.1 3-isopropylmalate dehydratase [Flavobacterium sp.]ODS81474.1 MAG: 3-isopropylmalate dehydratase [Chryseobacterium sp. SCN 40-13]OJV71096.1 MAG: 3-isopropylmalate dehydratase [Flavobacterium sp. 40-81]
MKITDLNGLEIKVTDLEKAIDQADYFKDAHHIPPVDSDKQRQEYWTDIYNKLLMLKNTINNKNDENIPS